MSVRALTVRHPWAWAIAHSGKRVENRSWGTKYRGPLLIHAGREIETHSMAWVAMRAGVPLETMERQCVETAGAFVCRCELVDVLPPEAACDQPWAEPRQYHWILGAWAPMRPPLTYARGRQGLWTPLPFDAGRRR